MGFTSFGAVAGLLLVTACGGSEFAADTSESGGNGGQGEGGAVSASGGASQGTSGAAGAGGTEGTVDASTTGGSGGAVVVDAGRLQDVSSGSGGTVVVGDAKADVGSVDAARASSCPIAEPTSLGHCSGALKCTYGTHPRLSCRKTYTCLTGQWALGAPTMCADPPICQPPYPQIGLTCTNVNSDCIWDSGLYCRCLACPDMGCPEWDCFPPPNGCATTPPNLGQPCNVTTATTCEYGECKLGTRVTVTCVDGFINWTFPNCQ